MIALAALGAAPSLGQEQAEGWIIPFAVAYEPDMVAGFNSAFPAEVPDVRARHFGWGLEFRTLVSGLLLGPMYMRTWDEVSDSALQVRTDASAILGELGLKIAPFSFLTIVPMVGVGGLSQSFSIRDQSGDVALPDLLNGQGRTVTLSPGMKLAGLAALELGFAVNTSSGRYGLALRGGYIYSPFNLTWRLANGSRLTEVPRTHLGGPFVTLGINIMPAAVANDAGK